MSISRKTLGAAAALLILAAGACDTRWRAYGDANSIIAVMAPELWEEVQEDVYAALEPTIRTVRDEKTFTVTYQDPRGEHWGNLRRFRLLFMAGRPGDPWVAEALERTGTEVSGPGLYDLEDVWAIGQTVKLVILPEEGGADEIRRHLPEIQRALDEQFRAYAAQRMFVSGVDSALADTLAVEGGFRLLLPKVYTWERHDSVFIFRNDNPDPSELIRQITVTWKSPIPQGMQAEDILAWRQEIADRYFSEPQVMVLDDAVARPFEYRGNYAYEIQAQWQNPPDRDWPAAGPFITRAIICENQNRMYLVDAWLYAPGKEKYEYMIQLQTILDSFRCGAA